MGIEMDAMKTLAVIFAGALAAGCAAHPDPIIDMKGVDLDQYDEDWAECESYTEEVLVAKRRHQRCWARCSCWCG